MAGNPPESRISPAGPALEEAQAMIARLLYAAVALCVLGTRPEHVAPQGPAPAVQRPTAAAPSGIGGIPPDFAIPRNSR
jgi:hypothetical protein